MEGDWRPGYPRQDLSPPKSREKSTSAVSLFGRPLQIIPVLKGKISLSFSLSLSSGMLGWDHLTIAEPYSFWNLPWFSIISYCFLDIFLSRFYWLWPRECLLCRGLPRTGPTGGPKGNEAPQSGSTLPWLGPNCPFICLRLLKLRGGELWWQKKHDN